MAKTDTDLLTFSVSEVAAATGISETSVRRSIADGQMPAIRLRGRVLVLAQPLLDHILRATGDATILAEDKAQAAAQREDTRLSAIHQAQEHDRCVALAESDRKSRSSGATSEVIFAR